uniref:Uncharacterized protein n=1 Tax=Octopus bimaculoides TaxID=37653 RepID=A0A0L8IEU7_OCTBM
MQHQTSHASIVQFLPFTHKINPFCCHQQRYYLPKSFPPYSYSGYFAFRTPTSTAN